MGVPKTPIVAFRMTTMARRLRPTHLQEACFSHLTCRDNLLNMCSDNPKPYTQFLDISGQVGKPAYICTQVRKRQLRR